MNIESNIQDNLADNIVSNAELGVELGVELVSDGTMSDGVSAPTINSVALTTTNATVAISTDFARIDTYSLKITKTDTTAGAGIHWVGGAACGLTSGSTYRCSVWVYIPSTQTLDGADLNWDNNAGTDAELATTSVLDTWVQLQGDFTDDDVQKFMWVQALTDTISAEFYYADLFSVREKLSVGM